MGKKQYLGGGTVLNDSAQFETYDPAEAQKRTLVSEVGPVGSVVRPSLEYSKQIEMQKRILLEKAADLKLHKSRRNPHVPQVFQSEVAEYEHFLDWAEAQPEFGEILVRRSD